MSSYIYRKRFEYNLVFVTFICLCIHTSLPFLSVFILFLGQISKLQFAYEEKMKGLLPGSIKEVNSDYIFFTFSLPNPNFLKISRNQKTPSYHYDNKFPFSNLVQMFYKKKSMPLKLCLQLGTHHGLIERLSHNVVYSLLCLYVYLYILCDTMSYIYIFYICIHRARMVHGASRTHFDSEGVSIECYFYMLFL